MNGVKDGSTIYRLAVWKEARWTWEGAATGYDAMRSLLRLKIQHGDIPSALLVFGSSSMEGLREMIIRKNNRKPASCCSVHLFLEGMFGEEDVIHLEEKLLLQKKLNVWIPNTTEIHRLEYAKRLYEMGVINEG
jgi:hypothetical protein